MVEVFWHDIRFALFVLLPCVNLSAFLMWQMFKDKASKKNEEKIKRNNRILLIFLLVLHNLPVLYRVFEIICRQFFAPVETFQYNISAYLFLAFPCVNLSAFFIYNMSKDKASKKNEEKIKRNNRILLIFLLVLHNLPVIYLIFEQFFAS